MSKMKMAEDDLKGFPYPNKVQVSVSRIDWECEGEKSEPEDYPQSTTVIVQPSIGDTVSDYMHLASEQLAEKYGCLVNGFRMEDYKYLEE